MNHRKWSIFFIAGAAIVYSCNKNNLNQQALGALDQSEIENKKGVEALLIGAYSMLDGISADPTAWGGSGSNWIYGSICGTEAHKGSDQGDQEDNMTPLEKFYATATNLRLAEKWLAVYTGVQRSNEVLRILKKVTDIDDGERLLIEAQARFLRGHYHFEAIKIWGNVPYVGESVTYESGNFHLANKTSIWPEIENDFKFAMKNLSPKMQEKGRVNKYAAEAFLAKAYMFQRKWDTAQVLLQDIITKGVTADGVPYALSNNYHDNFDPDPNKKNSPESVFAVQNSVNDGSFGAHGNLGDLLNYPGNNDGPGGGCCSFFQPSQYLVNHFKTDPNTGLPDLDNFNAVDVRNDYGIESDSSFTPYNGTLDPRLDWTIGRRGIPFLDWGLHPGKAWIRDQENEGPYNSIKNIYWKRQQGDLSDATSWTVGSTATNINLIRFADVLLWAAEVEVEIGSLPKATDYVNQVRRRMEDSSGWVHTYIDPNNPEAGFTTTNAAKYYIREYPTFPSQDYGRKAVQYERMLELGMEGHRFFDLVRWKIATAEINYYFSNERIPANYFDGFSFAQHNEFFPIPQTQIDLSVGADGVKLLIQNPGYP